MFLIFAKTKFQPAVNHNAVIQQTKNQRVKSHWLASSDRKNHLSRNKFRYVVGPLLQSLTHWFGILRGYKFPRPKPADRDVVRKIASMMCHSVI